MNQPVLLTQALHVTIPYMSKQETICEAIGGHRLLQFQYGGVKRVVEPHQLALNSEGVVVLNAFWIRGYSESFDKGNRWREYLVDEMFSVVCLDETFEKPRPGYRRAPNKKFESAIAEL